MHSNKELVGDNVHNSSMLFTHNKVRELSTNILSKLFTIYLVTFASLIILRDVFSVDIPNIVFILIATLFFLLSDLNKIIAFIVFIIPISSGVPYTFITFIALIIILLKHRNQFLFNWTILIPLVLISIEAIHLYHIHSNVTEFVRLAIFILFISIILLNKIENYSHLHIIQAFIMGYVLAGVDILWQTFKSVNFTQFVSVANRLGTIQQFNSDRLLVSPNVNTLGLFSIMTIVLILILIYQNGKNKYLLPILFFAFLIGYMTLSRSFIITLAIIIIIFFLVTSKNFNKLIKNIFILCITGVLIILLLKTTFADVTESLISRFEVEDMSNGRNSISEYYHNILLNDTRKLIFGVGIVNYDVKTNSKFSSHNATQEVVIAWGIIGLTIVTLFIFLIYQNGVRQITERNKIKIYFLPFFALLLFIQSGQFFSARALLLLLIVCFCSLRLIDRKENTYNKFGLPENN